jgi:ribosomal protein L7Ae-like RNA K-turn-binding protein
MLRCNNMNVFVVIVCSMKRVGRKTGGGGAVCALGESGSGRGPLGAIVKQS